MKNKKEFLSEGLKKMQRLAGVRIEETKEKTSSLKTESVSSEPITKFDKRNKNLLENVDRMKTLSGMNNPAED